MKIHIGVILSLAVCAVESKTFSFAVLGDFGTGGYEAGMFFEVISALGVHDTNERHDTQFTISTGDNIYNGDVNFGLTKSFEELWTRPGANGGGNWLLTRGNHDNIGAQIEYSKKNSRWILPSVFFTREIDTGLNFTVQVWSVDTHAFNNDQLQWLEKSLQKSTARWKFLFTHYPWISSGRHKRVAPPVTVAAIAKKYGVQAVFSGHDHLLQSCVHEGVGFIGSGATARGAMLDRRLEKDKTDFLWAWGLTYSVGFHGILQVSLTKNVMWGSLYSRTNMVHEFATVWDWPFKYNNLGEGNKATTFPSPKVVLQYLNEEADSTKPDEVDKEKEKEKEKEATPSPTNAIDTSKVATNVEQRITEKVISPEVLVKGAAPEKVAVFVATTSCAECLGPSVNKKFSLWVQGVTFGKKHRVFLAYSSSDCTEEGQNRAVAGTNVIVPTPVAEFTTRGAIKEQTDVFVCLSGDEGKTYFVLRQADTGVNSFSLYPEPPKGEAVTPERPQATAPSKEGATKQHLTRLINSLSSDNMVRHSSAIPASYFYILVAIMSVGIPIAWHKGRSAARQERRPTAS
eukprot:TRINITY_DN2555_c0_g4_i1.p1 TRINITY_DN2555_c0_g4~~TRINITY_DN2555_c0_g4_i1.p1  ORF type:complete len:571 (+),score=157.22 TRINITY_DN2555_c0_g4_i1:63-1775(+)